MDRVAWIQWPVYMTVWGAHVLKGTCMCPANGDMCPVQCWHIRQTPTLTFRSKLKVEDGPLLLVAAVRYGYGALNLGHGILR